MNPVLAQQEIHIIALRRRQLQAEVERDQSLRLHTTRSRHTVPFGSLMPAGVRAWLRTVRVRAESFEPRSAAAVAKETTGASI